MKSIGWIGVGIMGKPMVRNLQKAGYTLHIYARNREKVADVIQEGAIFHDTIGDCAQGRDAVITRMWKRSILPREISWTGQTRGPISST